MKLLLTSAMTAVLLSGAAFAQTEPTVPIAPPAELSTPDAGAAPPPPPPPSDDEDDGGPRAEGPRDEGPRAERDRMREERRERRDERREARREMREDGERRGPPHWRGGRGDHGPKREEGAHFRVNVDDDGKLMLDVKCADGEPMAACADVMMKLFDRLDPDSMSSRPYDRDDDR